MSMIKWGSYALYFERFVVFLRMKEKRIGTKVSKPTVFLLPRI